MTIPKDKLEKIEEFAKEKFKGVDYAHAFSHSERAVKIARFLAEKEGADVDVCVVAAWLHDVGQPQQERMHGGISAEIAGPFLEELGFDPKFIERVKHAIFCHDTGSLDKAKSIEDQVVYDSDKLQVIGPLGFCRGVPYFMMFKDMGMTEAVHLQRDIQKKKIEKNLQTKTAKKIAKHSYEVMQEFFRLFDIWDKADDLKKLEK